jgi:hypothetical protein
MTDDHLLHLNRNSSLTIGDLETMHAMRECQHQYSDNYYENKNLFDEICHDIEIENDLSPFPCSYPDNCDQKQQQQQQPRRRLSIPCMTKNDDIATATATTTTMTPG